MKRGIYEILHEVSILPSFKQRVEELKKHSDNKTLLTILRYTFDKNIKFLLPEGDMKDSDGKLIYKPSPYLDQQPNLYNEVKRLYLFVEGQGAPEGLTKFRREKLWIDFLENLDPKDAEILVKTKDHLSPLPNISEKLVKEAFPELL